MIWQDLVVMFANILMGYALIPQVYLGFKKKRCGVLWQTSFLTMLGLFVVTISFLTLGLFLSAVITGIMCFLWYLLLLQKILYK